MFAGKSVSAFTSFSSHPRQRAAPLTKKALAEAIDVTAHTVLRYESGQIAPATMY